MGNLTSKLFVAFIGLGFVAGIVLASPGLSPAKASTHSTTAKAPTVPPELNIGGMLFRNYCAACHGVDLMGTDQGPPFLHKIYEPSHHGDGSFFRAVKVGVRAHHWKFGNMEPVEGVNEKIVASIVKYVRYVQKKAGVF